MRERDGALGLSDLRRVLAGFFIYCHIDETDHAVPLILQFCNPNHYLAQANLSAAEVNRLRLGHRLQVAFRPTPVSAPLMSFVSLSGVTSAFVAQADQTPDGHAFIRHSEVLGTKSEVMRRGC